MPPQLTASSSSKIHRCWTCLHKLARWRRNYWHHWLLRYCICCIPHMRQMRYLMCCIDDLSQHTFRRLPPQGCSIHSIVPVHLAKEPWPQAQDPLNSAFPYTGQRPSCWTIYRHRVLVRCLHFVMRCTPLHLSHQSHAIAYLWHSMQ